MISQEQVRIVRQALLLREKTSIPRLPCAFLLIKDTATAPPSYGGSTCLP